MRKRFRHRVIGVLIGVATAVAALVAGPSGSGVAAAAPAGGFPHYDHVFTLVEENHGFDQIIGNPAAPAINNLAAAYGYASQYYAIAHPSGPNYVAMLGGGTFGVSSDNAYWLFDVKAPSLMTQLEHAGLSWKGYFQGMPYPGYRAYCYPVRCLGVPDSDTLYIAKHNGLVYFDNIRDNPAEMAKMQPMSQLDADLASGHVPNFAYLMPDECHDMHGAPPVCIDSGNPGDVDDNQLVSTADAYVASTVAKITGSKVWAQGNNAIVLTFDEGDSGDTTGCCGTSPGGGHALTVVITNHGPRKLADTTPYNHYSLLAGLQHAFGLGCLAATCDTADVKPMTPLFATDPNTPATPIPAALLTSAPASTPIPAQQSQSGTATAAPPGPAGHGQWQVVPSPNLSTNDNNLAAVSAPTADNAWAVGNYYTQDNPNVFRNLALHWDGRAWTALAPPNVGSQENTLFGVSALASGQAWAAGYYADNRFRIRALVEHYDGHAWSAVPVPQPGSGRDILFAVTAINDHDVWAVGGTEDGLDTPFRTLVEHWDGRTWTVLPSPDPGPSGDEFYGVAAAGPDDVWAVGQQVGTAFPSQALVEHWTGRSWTQVTVTGADSYDPYAAAVTRSGALIAGDQETGLSPQRTLALGVTNGHAQTLATPNVGTSENDFYAVTSAGDTVWAAGRSTDSDPNVQNHVTLIERLIDGQWSVAPSPSPGGPGGDNGLGGIAASPDDGPIWAVGAYRTADSANQTLIERYAN